MKIKLLIITIFVGFNLSFAQSSSLNELQEKELDSVITACVKKVNADNSIENIKASSQLMERLTRKYNTWSSNYYLLYFKTLIVRNSKDSEEAQNAYNSINSTFDDVLKMSSTNRQKSELYTLKGFLYLTILSSNPMKYGRDLSGKVTELFTKATSVYPENPRPIYLNALFQDGMSKFFNSKYNHCEDLLLANKHFVVEINERENYLLPTWGAEHTSIVIYEDCNCSRKEKGDKTTPDKE